MVWQKRSQPDNLVMLCKYFRVHIDREHNQFLKKWIMVMIFNLHSMTKLSGCLCHCGDGLLNCKTLCVIYIIISYLSDLSLRNKFILQWIAGDALRLLSVALPLFSPYIFASPAPPPAHIVVHKFFVGLQIYSPPPPPPPLWHSNDCSLNNKLVYPFRRSAVYPPISTKECLHTVIQYLMTLILNWGRALKLRFQIIHHCLLTFLLL